MNLYISSRSALFPDSKKSPAFSKGSCGPKSAKAPRWKLMGWNGGNVRTCYGTLLAEVSWLVSGIQICGWFHVMSNFLFVKYKLIWRIIWGIAIGWDDFMIRQWPEINISCWTENQFDLKVTDSSCHHKESNGPVFRVGSWLKAKESVFPKNNRKSLFFFQVWFVCLFFFVLFVLFSEVSRLPY